jgi:hypothetical protein
MLRNLHLAKPASPGMGAAEPDFLVEIGVQPQSRLPMGTAGVP